MFTCAAYFWRLTLLTGGFLGVAALVTFHLASMREDAGRRGRRSSLNGGDLPAVGLDAQGLDDTMELGGNGEDERRGRAQKIYPVDSSDQEDCTSVAESAVWGDDQV